MRKVTLLGYVIPLGWYTDGNEAETEASAHGCTVVESTGLIRGFFPVTQDNEFLTCTYMGGL